MAYKKTKTVEKVEGDIDRYLSYMRLGGKKPSRIYLTTKQYNILLEDRNKMAKDERKDAKEIKQIDDYKGFAVAIYNP